MIEFMREAAGDHALGVMLVLVNGTVAVGSAAASMVLGVEVPDGVLVALVAASISFLAWTATMIMKVVADQRELAVIVRELTKDVDRLRDEVE